MSETLKSPLLTCFLTDVSGVNMFTARKVISRHISPMIKEAEYRFPMVSTIFPNQKSKCWTLDKNAITMLNKTLTRGVIFFYMLLHWKVPSPHERKHVLCSIISRLSSNTLYCKFFRDLYWTVLPSVNWVLDYVRTWKCTYLHYSSYLVLLSFKRKWFLITREFTMKFSSYVGEMEN